MLLLCLTGPAVIAGNHELTFDAARMRRRAAERAPPAPSPTSLGAGGRLGRLVRRVLGSQSRRAKADDDPSIPYRVRRARARRTRCHGGLLQAHKA